MDSDLKLLSTKEVAEIMHCSLPTVRKIMRENKDFPLLMIGRQYKVSADSFRDWCNKRQA